MRNCLLFLCCCWQLGLYGQFPSYVEGESLDQATPAGFELLQQVAGDLNQDQYPDRVLLFEGKDPELLQVQEGWEDQPLDLNPRILAIYFFDPQTGTYRLQHQADSFIVRRDMPTMDEPFDMMRITARGVLEIQFHLWYSMGSWYMSEHTYKFRYQNERFALIGYEGHETHRGSGETTAHSINFSTRKMSITHGSILKGVTPRTEWHTFSLPKLRCLEDLVRPFRWEFEGIFL